MLMEPVLNVKSSHKNQMKLVMLVLNAQEHFVVIVINQMFAQ